MNASNKVTFTIILIFSVVFALLSLAMFFQAREDIAEERAAALQMAESIAATELETETLVHFLQKSRHLTVYQDGQTIGSPLDKGLFAQLLTPPQASTIITTSSGQRLVIVANSAAEIAEIRDTVVVVLGIFVFALLLTLFTLRYAVNTRLKPLSELCNGLDSIQSGRFTLAAASTDIAEIHTLINHYNNLISSLAKNESQVVRLRQRLAVLQENERRLLARELHDNLGQLITSITVQTYMLEQQKHHPEYIVKGCATIQHQCEAVHQGIRELTNQLYPVFLSKLGLTTSIAQLTQTWQDIHQIEVTWLPNAATIATDLDRDTQIYRITQEVFNNIARHANASKVTIGLTRSNNEIVLFVQDNGTGFNYNAASQSQTGLGLESMHERATLLGGNLHIDSTATGTTVTLLTPLPTPEHQSYENSVS